MASCSTMPKHKSLGKKQGSSRRSKWGSKSLGESGSGLGAGERAVQQGGVDDGGEVHHPPSYAAQLHGGQVEQRRDFAFCSSQSPRRGEPSQRNTKTRCSSRSRPQMQLRLYPGWLRSLAWEPGQGFLDRGRLLLPHSLSSKRALSLSWGQGDFWGRFIHYCVALSVNHW